MVNVAIVIFAVAAVLGLTILLNWMKSKNVSRAVIYSHGIVAASGLILLIIYAIQNPGYIPKASIILFSIAAIGGFFLFFLNTKRNMTPVGIAFIHAAIAISGFITLLIFAFE